MKQADTYKETRVINFPGMIARIHIPDIDQEERNRRMLNIKKAAANLLRGTQKK